MKDPVIQAGLKTLIARGLEQGYVTHDDIRACVPESAKSEDLLNHIARLLDEEDIADVFAGKPSDPERAGGRIANENKVFKRGVGTLLPIDTQASGNSININDTADKAMASSRRNGNDPSTKMTSLDLEVERLLRNVPASDGGPMHDPAESWEEEESRLARMRDLAAEDAAKQEGPYED